ncbi:MAG: YlxR family protein, partial [Candidatus Eremiobacteraeota bacterium]|nr:YlxR family protein [Candidatus Eremiobacteraeota bacterium]
MPNSVTRTCVGCRQRKEQAEMVRFVRTESSWTPDAGRRQEGRGAYLCSNKCAQRVVKNNGFPGL